MRRSEYAKVLGVLLLFWLVLALPTLWPQPAVFSSLEQDMLHHLDGAYRIRSGEVPHLAFMTPLGILAFLPTALFLGLGPGAALLTGQAVFALALTPLIAWVAATRMRKPLALAFGAVLILLLVSVMYGSTRSQFTMALSYNRWSWALFALAAVQAVVPVERKFQAYDGVVLGAVLSAMVLLKFSFFVAVLPGVALALLAGRRWHSALACAGTGAVVFALYPMWAGWSVWTAYADDLQFMWNLGIHAINVEPVDFLTDYRVLAALALILLMVPFLSENRAGFLVLAAGGIWAQFHAWGNDPFYLLGLCFAAVPLIRARPVLRVLPAMLAVLLLPVLFNLLNQLTIYPFVDRERFVAAPIEAAGAPMLLLPRRSQEFTSETIGQPETINGLTVPMCYQKFGYEATAHALALTLDRAGLQGAIVADLFSNYWMFGPQLPPKQVAIWQYMGGNYGLGQAAYLVVPDCPLDPSIRREFIRAANLGEMVLEYDGGRVYRLN